MYEYNQTRSFNLGIAQETSVEAALIYDDLAYAQQIVGKGKWFYRSYEQLERRLPYSEQTLRRHIKKLVDAGLITTKIKKVDGKPTCHYQIGRFVSTKLAETMETTKLADSIYKTTKETTKSKSELEKNLLALVNEVTGRSFRTLPERGVKKTLDAFSLEEIEHALRALARDPWHAEKLKEFKIDYLIRSTTIDKFLGQGPAKPVDKAAREKWDDEEEAEMKAFRERAQKELEQHGDK